MKTRGKFRMKGKFFTMTKITYGKNIPSNYMMEALFDAHVFNCYIFTIIYSSYQQNILCFL